MPYLFADFWFLTNRSPGTSRSYQVDTKSLPYQGYLLGIAVIPIIGLVAVDFMTMQKTYAVVGALFVPFPGRQSARAAGFRDGPRTRPDSPDEPQENHTGQRWKSAREGAQRESRPDYGPLSSYDRSIDHRDRTRTPLP